MDTIFVEARYKFDAKIKGAGRLPGKVALVGTIQYLDALPKIKGMLEETGKKVVLPKLPHSKHPGQILGCGITEIGGAEAILYLGDGEFHPIALMIKNKIAVFRIDPGTGEIRGLERKSKDVFERRLKGAILKFLSAKNIGILVSTKPGQARRKDALELKKKLAARGVGAYIFLFDTLDFSELVNFPFIDCYVNTACPRIAFDDYDKLGKPVVNIDDIVNL